MLLSNINAFRLSFPPKFRRPAQTLSEGPPDVEAITAIMLTHMYVLHHSGFLKWDNEC